MWSERVMWMHSLRTTWCYFFTGEMKSMPGQIFSSEPLLRDPGLWLAWQEKPIPHFLHSLFSLPKSLLRLGSANYSYSSSYEIHHCISEILDDFFHHWFLSATLSFFFLSHIIETNMSLVCECLQLWLHCCVSLKREKSSVTLMPSRLVCTFSIPGAWKYFQSWKMRKTLSLYATIVQGD